MRREGLVSATLAEKMLAWRHTGFSAHNSVRVGSRDASGRRRLAQLCAHIPDRFEHLERYAGWYSNRSRGKRRRMEAQPAETVTRVVDVREAARVRSTWDCGCRKLRREGDLGRPPRIRPGQPRKS